MTFGVQVASRHFLVLVVAGLTGALAASLNTQSGAQGQHRCHNARTLHLQLATVTALATAIYRGVTSRRTASARRSAWSGAA